MKNVKITVMRKAQYDDLIEKYENPIEHACDLKRDKSLFVKAGRSLKGFVTARGKAFLLS